MVPYTPKETYNIPKVIFYFDVVCPFAFMASEKVDDMARCTGAEVTWSPVLLGGLYDLTSAPQGKAGSATDVPVAAAKKRLESEAFQREVGRTQLPIKFHPQHPLRSLDAGRLLCAVPPESRPILAHALFKAYWCEGDNISNRATLLRIARSLKMKLPFPIDETIFSDSKWAETLRANTQEAYSRGVFGVPAFWIEERQKLFWGQDRMHLLEAELISIKVGKPFNQIRALDRLHPRCLRTPPEDRARTLNFWFDFSSPWAYLGWTQLERLQREAGPGLKIVLKPFLLGALFRDIGTPMTPMLDMIPEKQAYAKKDMNDWSEFLTAVNAQETPAIDMGPLNWPDEFPIRSVTALRVALVDIKTVSAIYRAAWSEKKRIADPAVLTSVLNNAGFDGDRLLLEATKGPKAEEVKAQLKANTDEAIRIGLCGAPSYQFEDHIVWGQDKLNVVLDLVQGWKPKSSKLKAKVSSFPHRDYRL